ncbi:conserved Plasmodium protein, unknown function [Plasmodium knowlesi strain H]|uniref:Uncharacterized protein n=3 Tax=Plasmodium knowlesi TaxID=5850 RepID=A0A5K1TX59_PLAKH|nr:conserved Plasmodium protein, unknown function [Plasmodium knowlesi strain H]OTN65080.1 Uncharacterized protein PKNOH_S120129200 [Plasmodium knowlesi]CAA9988155.1 conserved Plasmodium protein, unknown function [Plasmodium knowlesi strain H]SBO20055.1 conserved Plasmodium protein, unknown function [Plasmodium knowlesi strain H]SBO20769.1 conserved Plasmodium protein, unknown function [Plasmodium knowlesi strain H]VVS77629.1 conserved Plasmodium protein, unknown function [Plasmodium knowlesi |eukprot:XP_002259131.1 hypothetical protein, conserved in Plasmodium species [Plasmodium knowlesi strain H]
MNVAKFPFVHRNLFFISKNNISSLNNFFIGEKRNLLSKYGITNFIYHDDVALRRGDNVHDDVLKNSVLLNDSFFMCNLKKESQEELVSERPQQEILQFKNKKTRLSLRRKRKRMGERVSLRYR